MGRQTKVNKAGLTIEGFPLRLQWFTMARVNQMTPTATVHKHPQRPPAIDRRKDSVRCKSCGSSDLWRIDERPGIVAAIMRYRERKPFQCRACGWICYRLARRVKDNALPVHGHGSPLESTANLLELNGALTSASEQRDEITTIGASPKLSTEDQSTRVER